MGNDILEYCIYTLTAQECALLQQMQKYFFLSITEVTSGVEGRQQHDTSQLREQFCCIQNGIAAHTVSDQVDIVRTCVISLAKVCAAHIVCQNNSILYAVRNQIFPLTSPSPTMMRYQHHTANPAQRMGQIVIAGAAGKAVEQNHTRPQMGISAIRPKNLTV